MERFRSPFFGSTRMTSAPRSPRVWVASGPINTDERSITRCPANGPVGLVLSSSSATLADARGPSQSPPSLRAGPRHDSPPIPPCGMHSLPAPSRAAQSAPMSVRLTVPTGHGSVAAEVHGADAGSGRPVVVALHGLASNRATWNVVGRLLGDDVTLLALDLRGRGDSRDAGPPYGIRQHIADVLAAADLVGAQSFVVVGSSMGCYLGAALARLHPERVRALLLVDALLPRPMPAGVDIDAALAEDPVVGGAVGRIETTAADTVEMYRDTWRSNPAFAGTGIDDDVIVAFSDADMNPVGPPFRPGIRPESIVADGRELRLDADVADAAEHVQCPVWILRDTRGQRNGPRQLEAAQIAAAYTAHT